MIPGPATFLPLVRAAIHLGIGLYFLVGTVRKHGMDTKAIFALCCLSMFFFAYDDWIDFRLGLQG